MGVNLWSVIWGIEIFGPLIEKHGEGGQIVSTASIAGMVALTNPSYDVTKFGVVALSEDLRPKLAETPLSGSPPILGDARFNRSLAGLPRPRSAVSAAWPARSAA